MQSNQRRTRSLVLLAFALAAAGVLVLFGCAKKTPTAPQGTSGSQQLGAQLSRQETPDVASLMRVQEAHTASLMENHDILGTGLGHDAAGRAAILVLTRHALAGLPEQLDGVAVEQVVVGTVVAYARPGGGTLQCGQSTGNDMECAAGTIGCVVLKSGTSYFLSCNHVFARENAASIGERIDAPGRYDAHPKCAQTPICGTLAAFKAISFSSNNTIDAAIAAVDPSRAFTCAEEGGYTPSPTVVSPSVGLAVKKDGRTSGVTHATIQAINVTIQVQYSSGAIATFVSQIMTPGNFIRSGDSGSLMVTETGNNPVGLCFAGGGGGSFENPIGPVFQKFGATVCGQ